MQQNFTQLFSETFPHTVLDIKKPMDYLLWNTLNATSLQEVKYFLSLRKLVHFPEHKRFDFTMSPSIYVDTAQVKNTFQGPIGKMVSHLTQDVLNELIYNVPSEMNTYDILRWIVGQIMSNTANYVYHHLVTLVVLETNNGSIDNSLLCQWYSSLKWINSVYLDSSPGIQLLCDSPQEILGFFNDLFYIYELYKSPTSDPHVVHELLRKHYDFYKKPIPGIVTSIKRKRK